MASSSNKKFSSVYLKLPLLVFMLLLSYFFLFEHQRPYDLFDSRGYELYGFSDEVNGGQSKVLGLSEGPEGVVLDYQIGNNAIRYAGINFKLADSASHVISRYDHVIVNCWTQNVEALNFSLTTWEEGITIEGEEATYRVNSHVETSINDQSWQEIKIDFSELKTPHWWVAQRQKSKVLKGEPDWSRILQFSVLRAAEVDPAKPGKIIVKSVTFERSFSFFYLRASVILLLSIIGVVLTRLYRKRTSKVVVTYQSVVVQDRSQRSNWEDELFEYLGKNYVDCELKLEHLAKAFSKTERTISALIHDRKKMTFKQYLNSIRINEAKRLLLETKLSLKEIAFEVGYSSPHSFRRVFKQFEGLSPSDFKGEKPEE